LTNGSQRARIIHLVGTTSLPKDPLCGVKRSQLMKVIGLVFVGGVVVCGQVALDSFVEGGEQVELSRGVSRSTKFRRTSSTCPGAAFSMAARPAGRRQTIVLRASLGLGSRLTSPSFCMRRNWWETRLFSPAQCAAQLAGGHPVPVVSREHCQDRVVGPGQARFLQASVEMRDELIIRIHEGPPGAVLTRVEPVRLPSASTLPRLVDASPIAPYG